MAAVRTAGGTARPAAAAKRTTARVGALQALEVRQQRVLEHLGELGLVAQGRGDQLLGEERVALRAGADGLDQLGGQRARRSRGR